MNATPLRGSRPRVAVKFRDEDNGAINPSVLYFYFSDSQGNETSYRYGVDAELVKDADGDYHVDVPVTLPEGSSKGKYYCRFEAFDGAGLELAAAEAVLEVYTRYIVRTA